MELLSEVAEAVLVVVAGWEGLVERVAGHADERRTHKGPDIKSREVFRVVIWILAPEGTAGVDSLEDRFAICILAVDGAAGLPVVAIDDDPGVAGRSAMAIEDEGLEDLRVLDHESAVLKDRFGITVRYIRDRSR